MIPGTREFMKQAEFWIQRTQNAYKVIMTPQQIQSFNKRTIEKAESMTDLRAYPVQLSHHALKEMICAYKLPLETRYGDDGQPVEAYDKLLENRNLQEIKETNRVHFGITINNSRLRSFPTDEGSYSAPDDIEFDQFQETECPALEPVAVLHASADGQWLFVQIYNYIGWLQAKDLAVARSKEQLLHYVEANHFLVVTGNKITTQYNPYENGVSQKEYYMGTRIPLAIDGDNTIGNQLATFCHIVLLPVRDSKGELTLCKALVAKTEDASIGWLPYSRANLLKQAFKLQGERYDWGGKHNGRDCSGFVLGIYRTFGIQLPRNAGAQEHSEGVRYVMPAGAGIKERTQILTKTNPGAAIFMPGHVMLYIGEIDGEAFMIHAFHRYGVKVAEEFSTVPVNSVAVTSTLLLGKKGRQFLEEFTSVVLYE